MIHHLHSRGPVNSLGQKQHWLMLGKVLMHHRHRNWRGGCWEGDGREVQRGGELELVDQCNLITISVCNECGEPKCMHGTVITSPHA